MAEQEAAPNHEPHDSQSVAKLALVMLGLCLAVFLTGMDQTILATAAPTISDDFHSLEDLGWWTASYLLALSTFQLFYGKLYSLFSIKNIYLGAITVFELGSLISTTAPNATALIFGRSISGLGAAGIFSGGILITTKIIAIEQRAVYLGIMSASFGVAAVVGPFIGGALTERSTWRWCFGINLPLGVVTIILCSWLVKTPVNEEIKSLTLMDKLKQFDVPGTVLLIASLVCLLLGLQWGGSTYAWSNGRIIALLVLAGVFFVTFILSQAFGSHSHTIPSSITHTRSMWFAASFDMCITGAVYVNIVYFPVWFQAVKNASPFESGAMLTPLIAGYVVCSILAGILTSASGYYVPSMAIGTVLTSVGAGLLTTLEPQTPSSSWIGFLALYGFGVGFGFGQPTYVAQTLLPECDVPIGVTLITLVQNLSASIFVAAAQSVFQNTLANGLGAVSPQFAPSTHFDGGGSVTNITALFPPADRPLVVATYSRALVNTIYISLALSCLSVVGLLGTKWTPMKNKNSSATTVESTTGGNVTTEIGEKTGK